MKDRLEKQFWYPGYHGNKLPSGKKILESNGGIFLLMGYLRRKYPLLGYLRRKYPLLGYLGENILSRKQLNGCRLPDWGLSLPLLRLFILLLLTFYRIPESSAVKQIETRNTYNIIRLADNKTNCFKHNSIIYQENNNSALSTILLFLFHAIHLAPEFRYT